MAEPMNGTVDPVNRSLFSVSGHTDHIQVHKVVKGDHHVQHNDKEQHVLNGILDIEACRNKNKVPPCAMERSISTSAIEHSNSKDLYKDDDKNETKALNTNGVHTISCQPKSPFYVGEPSTPDSNCVCEKDRSHDKTKSNNKSDMELKIESLSVVGNTDQNDNVKTNLPLYDMSTKPPPGKRNRSSIQGKQSWLLRLFESKLFDMSIAISYLFNSKEPGVQSYLGEYDINVYLYIYACNTQKRNPFKAY